VSPLDQRAAASPAPSGHELQLNKKPRWRRSPSLDHPSHRPAEPLPPAAAERDAKLQQLVERVTQLEELIATFP
jgi:hypothetical protein